MTATLDRDGLTGRQWLTFPGKPDPTTIAALKAHGWRWSGYRKAWHHPSKFAKVPVDITYNPGGTVDYAAERAERLEDRAQKAQATAAASFQRADAEVAGIPMGQPILVGHHSERHHRAALRRCHSAMRKGCDEADKAQHLEQLARGSQRAQAQREKPGAIARRIERLRKDLQKLERVTPEDDASRRNVAWVIELATGTTPSPEEITTRIAEHREERAHRAAIVRTELAAAEAALAEAGGLPADHLHPKPGDVVRIHGHLARVVRVNSKTLTCEVLGIGPFPHQKYEKCWLQEILRQPDKPEEGL